MNNVESGTILKFSTLKSGITNTLDYIRKAVALYFRFTLVDENFTISINGTNISTEDIKELTDKTEFLWTLNKNPQDALIGTLFLLSSHNKELSAKSHINGFIASVKKPRDLKILGTGEKIGVDLFVNGRLRERDILKHIQSARVPESYMYGQIHYDLLDSDDVDRFTSSREGVVADDTLFIELLEDLQDMMKGIFDDWDKWRLESKEDGDDENKRLSPKSRASKKLYHEISSDYAPELPNNSEAVKHFNKWVNDLEDDAIFNQQSYTECFISENLVRKYIEHKKIDINNKENLAEIKKWREREIKDKQNGNLSIDIRDNNNDLFYLSMPFLAKTADPQKDYPDKLPSDEKPFTPIRNAVMHTSRLTQDAKDRLTTVYTNIKARVKNLLSS